MLIIKLKSMYYLFLFLAIIFAENNCKSKAPVVSNSNDNVVAISNLSNVANLVVETNGLQDSAVKIKTEEEIWHGHSGKFDLRWTTKDLYVTSERKTEKIFSTYAEMWAKEVTKNQKNAINKINFKILSVVGDIVTIEIANSITGNDSGTLTTSISWITVDLSKSGKISLSYNEDEKNIRNADLTDYFSKQDILSGLLSNETVKNALEKKNLKEPDSIEELLDNKYLSLNDAGTYQLNGYSLNKFAFEEINSNDVTIALEILDAYNFHQYNVVRIYIKLPLPEKLHSSLLKSKIQEEGFLHGTNTLGLQDKSTEFVFKTN